ncbi:ATP-binding protein [Actinoplanes sp. N902-109]|uniref:sensor histidine kinase n=1 Tax=Actinoplanes sp. (strain N902-109) TaxID=649831 RepID=UPI0003295369|nr:sensor histidine kinase [Actinoplanes sp. N902-109]AGL14351.1 multi-sensor signal transduction histidine kinase [Actinoplanes sp. N902-109]
MSLLNIGTWTLRRRVLALCVTVGVLLAALGVVAAFTAANSNRQLDNVVNRASPMRAAGERLSTAMVDQETGIRGYAISGKVSNLRPYDDGRRMETAQVAQIEGLLRSGPLEDKIRGDLAVVRQRAATWHTQVADPILNAVRTQGPDAGQALVDASTTTAFDELRGAIDTMQNDIGVLRKRSADAAKDASQQMVAIQIAAAAIIVLAGAALMLGLDRLISRPVTHLAGQVRDVAEGDYDKHIDSQGAPELRSLADDVDGMRQQIAAELTEVREARQQVEWVNEQLKLQADELTRSNRDLEQFAYVASHDLQEPLRKVASFCQLLQRRYAGQMDERADQYIAFAVDGAQRMQRLINDLLAFSRIGRLTSGFTDVDLNRVLTEVRSQLEPRAGNDAEITWTDLPTVEGEEPLLTTLFVNLIGNSLKFHRPDVPARITVTAALDDSGDEWRVNVRDNGIGIEAEFADKVFVIFQRLHARDAYEGTGIGLAIVKKIVEYHGGRIWLDLEVSEGTSVWFTLPVLAGVPVPEKVKEGAL